jgi:hypothetical protein
MAKNNYERRLIREAKEAAMPKPVRTVEWHKENVIKRARKFAEVYVTTIGFGAPVAQAGWALNDAVERLEAAEIRERSAKRAESKVRTAAQTVREPPQPGDSAP